MVSGVEKRDLAWMAVLHRNVKNSELAFLYLFNVSFLKRKRTFLFGVFGIFDLK